MKTFRDFYNRIQTLEGVKGQGSDISGGIFKLDKTWGFQLYSGRQQVNVGHLHAPSKGLDSWANFVFDAEGDKVTMFSCPSPGICDYQSGKSYPMDTELYFQYPINNGDIIRGVLRDFMGSEVFNNG